VREFVARALQTAGYDVVVASNSPEALNVLAQRGPFDGFVVDFFMPGLSGANWHSRSDGSRPTRYLVFHRNCDDSSRLFSTPLKAPSVK